MLVCFCVYKSVLCLHVSRELCSIGVGYVQRICDRAGVGAEKGRFKRLLQLLWLR